MFLFTCQSEGASYSTPRKGIYISSVVDLNLYEYCQAMAVYCEMNHNACNRVCSRMITAAQIIMENGICSLAHVAKTVFPVVVYQSENAKQKFMKIPLVIICTSSSNSGKCELLVQEYIPGTDYIKVAFMLERITQQSQSSQSISKVEFKKLLSLGQTEYECMCLSYSVFKVLGLSAKCAKKHYGMTRTTQCNEQLEKSIHGMQTVRECIDQISILKGRSLLESMGFEVNCDSESDKDSDNDDVGEDSEAISDSDVGEDSEVICDRVGTTGDSDVV